nr:hypothetical protein [Tanacetum cinerariifolium]
MSISIHPIIVPSDSDVEDAFFSTHSQNYFPALPGNTSPDPSDDLSKYLLASLAISPFHDDPYMKFMQAYNATSNESPIPLPRAPIASPTVLPPYLVMPPKRTSTSAALPMTKAAIKKLVSDSVAVALEAQATIIVNTNNTNKNIKEREAPVARICSYKEFMSCQPFNFKGIEGVVGLIRWFERTELVFSCSNCTEDYKLKIAIGNDLKTYIRRFQKLVVLCLTMVPNSEKLMEIFIEGIPRSIEGNVTASKPQTLKEAITIT